MSEVRYYAEYRSADSIYAICHYMLSAIVLRVYKSSVFNIRAIMLCNYGDFLYAECHFVVS